MGYQESFLFCKTKKDVMNLCRVLNKAQEELDSYGVYAFAVGKYKKPLHITNPFCDAVSREFSQKGYFVWWGGERHPIQSGDWLYAYISEHFGDGYVPFFQCIFAEYIEEIEEILKGIDQNKHGVIQSNDYVDILNLPEDCLIDLTVIKSL